MMRTAAKTVASVIHGTLKHTMMSPLIAAVVFTWYVKPPTTSKPPITFGAVACWIATTVVTPEVVTVLNVTFDS